MGTVCKPLAVFHGFHSRSEGEKREAGFITLCRSIFKSVCYCESANDLSIYASKTMDKSTSGFDKIILALPHPAFRRQFAEALLEVPLFGKILAPINPSHNFSNMVTIITFLYLITCCACVNSSFASKSIALYLASRLLI